MRRRVLSALDSTPEWEKIKREWYYGHPGRRAPAEMEEQLRATDPRR